MSARFADLIHHVDRSSTNLSKRYIRNVGKEENKFYWKQEMINGLPLDIVRLIYSFDSTYLDLFRQTVLPTLRDKSWARIFCRIEGLTRNYFFVFDQTTFLSVWTDVSDFEDDEDEDENYLFLT